MSDKYAVLIAAIERGVAIKKIYNKDGEYDGFDLAYDTVPAKVRRHRHGGHHKGHKRVSMIPLLSVD